ncbi:CKLF-like MARVEL transmembrane domain-containing protein 7 [Fukomys damarensis]|uniref:CKLF-like MARVEL transmembrane domain-containing protein 7 n=1 Tax=Fukomys damarensis TaxID=885580 RepID=UPI001454FEED|nr:CKLF-like MARVEL transmembrane domain-containing protein 7 [Fukomys damarensis]
MAPLLLLLTSHLMRSQADNKQVSFSLRVPWHLHIAQLPLGLSDGPLLKEPPRGDCGSTALWFHSVPAQRIPMIMAGQFVDSCLPGGHLVGFLVLVPQAPVLKRCFSDISVFTSQVTLLIAFICVRSSLWTDYSAYSFFEVVTICDLIMILIFYLVHLFRFYRVLTCISWPLSELLHYLIGTLLLLIASIVAASKSYNQSGLVAGAVFGFLATFLCLASVWLSYKISCVTQSTDAAV